MYYMWNWWWVFSWIVPMLLLAWVIFGVNYRRYGAQRFERYRDYWDDYDVRPARTRRAPGHRGRGPRNYIRADARIRDDVCDRLLLDEQIDARAIEVNVADGTVKLSGVVTNRSDRRVAEWLAEGVPGVGDVDNRLLIGDIEAAMKSHESDAASAQQALPAEHAS